MQLSKLITRVTSSSIAKDSFWAIIGNGIGSFLLLLAGIFIARILGKDLYGEYGVAKSNMLYMAGFATFGLVFTSTRYIAKYCKEDCRKVRSLVKCSLTITSIFSIIIAAVICLFSNQLAIYLNTPQLGSVFRFLSALIVIKAVGSTSIGILAGLKKFKAAGLNNIISGIIMVVIVIPLSKELGLKGALISLVISQSILMILNLISIKREYNYLPPGDNVRMTKEMISFSFPVALQEISFAIFGWLGIMLLTKYSSVAEVGIYSATAQWNAIILFLPSILSNVVLSHLSARESADAQSNKIKKLLKVYLFATIVPFLIIYFASPLIASAYGPQFVSMIPVLQVLTLATIPQCCSDVFKSELMSQGRTWLLFSLRNLKDLIFIITSWVLLKEFGNGSGALIYAFCSLGASVILFSELLIAYLVYKNKPVLK